MHGHGVSVHSPQGPPQASGARHRASSRRCTLPAVRSVPAVALQQFGAFTLAQALACGWTDSAVRHAVRSGRLDRIRPGVFWLPPATDGHASANTRAAADAVAVLLRVPACVASHRSAAIVRGLPVLRRPDRPCVTVPPGYSGDLAGAHLHRAPLRPGEVQRRGALRTTAAVRTIVDVARESGVADGLVVADAAFAAGLADGPSLARAIGQCRGWAGMRAARRVLDLADGRAESPLESVSRLTLADGGLPVPDLQPDLYDLAGRHLGRPDFYWDDLGVVGEADGAEKYRDPGDLYREKRRQDRMDDAGLVVFRWGWADVGRSGRLPDLAHRAFARAQQRGGARDWVVLPASRCP